MGWEAARPCVSKSAKPAKIDSLIEKIFCACPLKNVLIFTGFVQRSPKRKGGVVFALPPAEPVNEIGSDIFKYTPPIFRIRILGDCCLAPPEAGRGGKLVVYKLAVPFG